MNVETINSALWNLSCSHIEFFVCAFLETKKYERIMGYLKILKIMLGLWHWVAE